MAVDAAGNVYVCCVVADGDPALVDYEGIIRKLAPSGPTLQVSRGAVGIRLSWPTNTTGYIVESTDTLAAGAEWKEVPSLPTVSNGENVLTIGDSQPKPNGREPSSWPLIQTVLCW